MKLRQLYAESEPSLSYFYESVTTYYTRDWHSYRFLKFIQKKKIYLSHIHLLNSACTLYI